MAKETDSQASKFGNAAAGGIPVLLVATLKGGVGKTTLTANLAAYFAMRWMQTRENSNEARALRILLIDGDFQGSLTSMVVNDTQRFVLPSKATRLVSGDLLGGGLAHEAAILSRPGMRNGLPISIVPAYYDLAQAENRTLIEWLLPATSIGLLSRLKKLMKLGGASEAPTADDLRFRLAETLLHPSVQKQFDLIIIDAPPRLTSLHAQAICASTHLLIPTIVDGLSGDAVARYLDQVSTFRGPGENALAPQIEPIGVACTMVGPQQNIEGAVNLMRQRISASKLQCDILDACVIRSRSQYRDNAGNVIAYAHPANNADYQALRNELDRLGDYVAGKLGASGRQWQRAQ